MNAFLIAALLACGSETEPPASTPTDAPEPAPAVAPEAAQANAVQDFGQAFAVEEVLAASELLSDPGSFDGKTVRVSGRVADVCQKAGCWMVIADGDQTMRIRMKDHGFAVAKDAAGTSCEVEGTVVSTPVDPATVAHFEEESKTGIMPEKAAVDGVTWEIEATGVRITRG